jgi:hypothetical protein
MSIASNYPAIKPSLLLDFSNTEALDSRVTFTRASTATYYGTQTAKAEENLLTYSQEFDNAVWIKTNSSVTANTTVAPDGTTTADTMTASAATGFHIITAAPTSLVLSNGGGLSFFAKAGTASFVQLFVGGTAVPYANFDLSTGAASGFGAGTTASIVSVGNGWYRCQLVTTTTATNSFQIGIVTNISAARAESWTAAGTETVLLWGAQAENRQVVTAYTPTTSQPITNYIPVLETAASGVARFDHNPTTFESLGLLVEEQRTNLLLYSEQFDNSWWLKQVTGVGSAPAVTANAGIAPDGTQSADLVVFALNGGTTSNDVSQLSSTSLSTTAQPYTGSFWAKTTDNSTATFTVLNPDGTQFTRTVTSAWTRITFTSNGVVASSNFRIRLRGNEGTSNYASILLWGAQLEAGAFATSYIPTVASQVTRAADAASMTGTNFSSWYRADRGTLYANFRTVASTNFPQVFNLSDGGSTNSISIDAQSGLRAVVVASGTTQVLLSSSKTGSGDMVSFGYKVNDFAASFNGAASVTDTTGTLPVLTTASIGRSGSLNNFLNGTIKKLAFYPERISDTQLQGLTS